MQPTSPNSVSQVDTVGSSIEPTRLYENVLVYLGSVYLVSLPRRRHAVIYPENQQGTDPDIILNHLDPREPRTLPRQ